MRDRWLVKLIRLLSALPLSMLYLIADGLFLILFYVIRYQRNLVIENLRGAFPDLSTQEIYKLARNSYRNTTQVLVEIIKAQRMDRSQLIRRAPIENSSAVQKFLDAGKSVLILTTHQCNWEWSQLACSAYFDYPVQVVYKPLSHPQLDSLLGNIRGRFDSQMIPARQSLKLLKNRSQAKLIVLAADLGPRPDEKQVWHKFMHQDTAFYPGAGLIAQRLQVPVFFAGMTRTRRGYYCIRVEHLFDNAADATEESIMSAYVNALEKSISANPAGWLWLNKRWKYPNPNVRNP